MKFLYISSCSFGFDCFFLVCDGSSLCFQAALRKICCLCDADVIGHLDYQQLIQPRLMDSFLMCSHSDENFVWLPKMHWSCTMTIGLRWSLSRKPLATGLSVMPEACWMKSIRGNHHDLTRTDLGKITPRLIFYFWTQWRSQNIALHCMCLKD